MLKVKKQRPEWGVQNEAAAPRGNKDLDIAQCLERGLNYL